MLSLSEAPKGDPKSGVVVALDILRASTTIVTAFRNGCAEIVPVASVDDAREISRLRQGVLLGGERKEDGSTGSTWETRRSVYPESVCGRSV